MLDEKLQSYFDLSGKRALVTGAGRGIGQAMAEAVAAAGAEVLIHYHQSREAAEKVVEGIVGSGGSATAIQADLTDVDAAKGLLDAAGQRWGGLDILINNAGDLVQRCPIADMADDVMDQIIRVNIYSALYVTRAAIPLLRRGRHPAVVNIGSIAGHNGGGGGSVLYASAKGAIHTFTRGIAKELAPEIRVNAIAPGVIMTDFHRRHTPEPTLAGLVENTPLKRLGEAEDHAAACLFLCGVGSSFITGETIEVNGGLWVR